MQNVSSMALKTTHVACTIKLMTKVAFTVTSSELESLGFLRMKIISFVGFTFSTGYTGVYVDAKQ